MSVVPPPEPSWELGVWSWELKVSNVEHRPVNSQLSTPNSKLGLTLVELLVALAILVTVSSSTLLIFRGVTRAWRLGDLRTERYQQARLLFDLFSRELASCVASPQYPLIGLPAGEDSLLHEGSAVHDELMFVGTLPGRAGFVERGYWVTAEGDLMCHDDESRDGEYATGTSDLCGRGLASLTLSYFDGSDWVDAWEADPLGTLPKAVHIILGLGREKPEQFELIVYVPTS